MKKIIVAFDGMNYPAGALKFAAFLNDQNASLVTGAFVPNISFAGSFVYPTEVPVAGAFPADEEALEVMEENVHRFENYCEHHGIEYRVHKDETDFAVPQLRYETRFADLMLLSSESFYSKPEEKRISELFKEMLHLSECPVLIVPEEFTPPQEIVIAYDGSEDSVYALKQFAYLFPELALKPTVLVYANPKANKDVPDLSNIEELAARHFPDLSIEKLALMPRDYFATWINVKRSPMLVAGSYGRSTASRVFKKSFISEVMEFNRTSVFIAHR